MCIQYHSRLYSSQCIPMTSIIPRHIITPPCLSDKTNGIGFKHSHTFPPNRDLSTYYYNTNESHEEKEDLWQNASSNSHKTPIPLRQPMLHPASHSPRPISEYFPHHRLTNYRSFPSRLVRPHFRPPPLLLLLPNSFREQ